MRKKKKKKKNTHTHTHTHTLRYFCMKKMGDKICKTNLHNYYKKGLSVHHNWYAKSHLAIDQSAHRGKMIENYHNRLQSEAVHTYER